MQSAHFTAKQAAKSARISLSKFSADAGNATSMADRDGLIRRDGRKVLTD